VTVRVPFGVVAADSNDTLRVVPQPEHAPSPETNLVARLRRNDLAALGEVYDAHHTHVRAFGRKLLGDDTAAEDLVQDTFLALPNAVARFRGDSSLRTFLVSIAVNRARHHLRGALRRRAVHGRFEAEPPPSSPNPEKDVRRGQLAVLITRALDALPLDQRIAIVLCEVEGRSSVEAGQIVGVPEGTIRTRVFHAKRKLREALSDEGLQ
jgi:RNA polymerase sigma-70 factor, ECF subfamily